MERDTLLDSNLNRGMIFGRKKETKNENKYVNDSTLRSYLSIQDLHKQNTDNINLCKENLARIEQRGNKMDKITNKTDNLVQTSQQFNTRSRHLKRFIYLNYISHIVGILFFVLLIIFLIVKLS